MSAVFLIIILCTCTWHFGGASSVSKMQELLFAKLNNTDYTPRVRPIKDSGNVLSVAIDMYLVGLNGVDEVEQKITTTAYLRIVWADTFMTWNTSDYEGIQSFTLPQNAIWKPDLALANAYDSISGLGDSFLQVVVTNDGNITWHPFQVFDSTCNLDMTYFPFDTQICDLQLVTWSSTKDMISLIAGSDGLNIAEFENNANWELLEVSTLDSSTTATSGLSFRLKLKRKPLYYLINFIIPIFLLAVLNTFVFVLPCDSGEKSGYAMVLFLSFAIFLLIVTETMPEGMNSIPVMSSYLIIECVFSTVIVVISILQLRLHNQGDDTPIPAFLEAFTNGINAIKRFVCCDRTKAADANDKEDFMLVRQQSTESFNSTKSGNGQADIKTKRSIEESGMATTSENKIVNVDAIPPPSKFSTAVQRFLRAIRRDPKVVTDTPTPLVETATVQETDIDEDEVARIKRLSEIFRNNKIYPESFFSKPPTATITHENADDDLMDARPVPPSRYGSRASTPIISPLPQEYDAPSPSLAEEEEEKGMAWPDVVLAIDSLLFVLFFVVNTLAMIITYIVTASG